MSPAMGRWVAAPPGSASPSLRICEAGREAPALLHPPVFENGPPECVLVGAVTSAVAQAVCGQGHGLQAAAVRFGLLAGCVSVHEQAGAQLPATVQAWVYLDDVRLAPASKSRLLRARDRLLRKLTQAGFIISQKSGLEPRESVTGVGKEVDGGATPVCFPIPAICPISLISLWVNHATPSEILPGTPQRCSCADRSRSIPLPI